MSKLQLHDSQMVRHLFVACGCVAMLLAVLGVFLPVLPSVPFVLLAAACFARGSQRFHGWLLEHHITGPIVRDWYRHRSLPPGIKGWAFFLMTVSFGSSIYFVPALWLKLLLAVLGATLALLLWRIPVRAR